MCKRQLAAQEILVGGKRYSQVGVFEAGESVLEHKGHRAGEEQQRHIGQRELYITVLTRGFKSQRCVCKLEH